MKAVIHRTFGAPEVLEIADVSQPEPRRGEALVKVQSASINHYDILSRRGIKTDLKLPRIVGMDAAGTLEETRGVRTDIAPGDRVLILGETLGLGGSGAFSEYVVVPESEIQKIPDEMSCDEAACVGISYLTAYYALHHFPGPLENLTIAIPGASGGVATAALQIAKARKNKVFAITRDEAARDGLLKLGADSAFAGYTDQTQQAIRELSNGGVDVVINAVGGPTIPFGFSLLRHAGRQFTIGSAAGRAVEIDLFAFLIAEQELIGVNFGHATPEFRADVYARFLTLWRTGTVRILISRVFDLGEIVEAHRFIESRAHLGKVVIRISQ